jgi:hypothetical protein
MPKAILVCVVLLSGLTFGATDQTAAQSGTVPKADMSKRAAFDAACRDAVALVADNYNDRAPLSSRALANVKMCNGHPSETICDATSRAMLREYGKTPFTCGTDVADSVPLVFPPERSPP